MPLYDFKCDQCQLVVEEEFTMLRVPEKVICPRCKDNLCFAHRVFTPPVLNLNHWVPDYRNCDDGQKEAVAAGIYE